MSFRHTVFPPGTEHLEVTRERGSFELWATPNGLIATHLVGHGLAEFADLFVQAAERFLKEGKPIRVFHDWEHVTDYDLAVRQSQVQWVTRHKKLIDGLHILIRARLLSIGVTTASMMLSLVGFPLHAYREREPFDAAFSRAPR